MLPSLEEEFESFFEKRTRVWNPIEGLKIKEIAERMNRSPAAVKQLLSRALVKLKASFGETESLHLPDRELRGEGGEGSRDGTTT